MDEWSCPNCQAKLNNWRCNNCNQSYLEIGGLPILVPSPLRALCHDYVAMVRGRGSLAGRLAAMAPTRVADTARFAVMDAMVAAMTETLGSWQRLTQPLAAALDVDALGQYLASEAAAGGRIARSDASYDALSSVLDYAVRDWSGLERGERELAAIMDLLAVDHEGGHALVLGAGTGRIAVETLARHDQVTAIERSLAMAMVYARCRAREPLRLSADIHQPSAARVGADAYRCPPLGLDACGSTLEAEALARLRYAIADARQLPLADASVDVVYSVFFTDVLPLRELLPELHRVLRPGAKFVHLGPLLYHFPRELDKLHIDELEPAFARAGFAIDPGSERWSSLEHLGSDAGPEPAAKQVTYVSRFVATRTTRPRPTAESVPVLAAPLELVRSTSLPAADPAERLRVRTVDGRVLQISESIAACIELIDGKRDLGSIIAQLGERGAGLGIERVIGIIEGLTNNGLVMVKSPGLERGRSERST